MAKRKKKMAKSGGTKKDSGKKFTFSADRMELTKQIDVLETKKEIDIIPKLERDKKTKETLEELELKSRIEEKTDVEAERDNLIGIKTKKIKKPDKKKGTLIEEEIEKKTIFNDIGSFLEELLLDSYVKRYDYWEDSTNSMLAVLRNTQMANRKNSEILVEIIEKFQERISKGLERFKIKRDYVEKFSETNSAEIAEMLKRTLNLLALQLKEFKIKNQLDQIILK